MSEERRVRLYPTGKAYFPGVKARERLVPPDLAEVLTGGVVPAFTRERPDDREMSDHPLEDTSDIDQMLAKREEVIAGEEPASGASEGGTDNG